MVEHHLRRLLIYSLIHESCCSLATEVEKSFAIIRFGSKDKRDKSSRRARSLRHLKKSFFYFKILCTNCVKRISTEFYHCSDRFEVINRIVTEFKLKSNVSCFIASDITFRLLPSVSMSSIFETVILKPKVLSELPWYETMLLNYYSI